MADYDFTPAERQFIGEAGALLMWTLTELGTSIHGYGGEWNLGRPGRQIYIRLERGSHLVDITLREDAVVVTHGPWEAAYFDIDTRTLAQQTEYRSTVKQAKEAVERRRNEGQKPPKSDSGSEGSP